MLMQSFRSTALIRTVLASAALAGGLTAGSVNAQGYAGPGSASAGAQTGYAGPSSIAITTVKSLLETGRDDQNAILRGRIVSYDGDEHYTFEDETGRMRLDIDHDKFPVGVKIDDKTLVELHGELDRDRNSVEFDVDEIRVVQQ